MVADLPPEPYQPGMAKVTIQDAARVEGVSVANINQDLGHEVRSAIRVLIAKAYNVPLIESQERIRIDIFLRDTPLTGWRTPSPPRAG